MLKSLSMREKFIFEHALNLIQNTMRAMLAVFRREITQHFRKNISSPVVIPLKTYKCGKCAEPPDRFRGLPELAYVNNACHIMYLHCEYCLGEKNNVLKNMVQSTLYVYTHVDCRSTVVIVIFLARFKLFLYILIKN